MHERTRRALERGGWTDEEWERASWDHPVGRLYAAGRGQDAARLLREYACAHEAGHAVLGSVVGYRPELVVVGHLHELGGQARNQTAGYTLSSYRRGDPPTPEAVAMYCLGGIAGVDVVYPSGWGLDRGAFLPPAAVKDLRDEGAAGGDVWEARDAIRLVVTAGGRVLGQPTVGGALVAAMEQAEAILLGHRGKLLRLSAHLLSYGKADRSVIEDCLSLPE